jgi:hypothetical protein
MRHAEYIRVRSGGACPRLRDDAKNMEIAHLRPDSLTVNNSDRKIASPQKYVPSRPARWWQRSSSQHRDEGDHRPIQSYRP